MKTIGTEQQNRSKRAGTVLLDNHTQDIQDLLERNAGGDHLEKALFADEQCLPSLALSDVYRGTNITTDFARLIEDGSADNLNVLNRSSRKRESNFHDEFHF